MVSLTGIPMTQENRLAILQRAREILDDRENFAEGTLREERDLVDGKWAYRYCVLGACEQAVYDLGLAQPINSFGDLRDRSLDVFDAYLLGRDLSLHAFAEAKYQRSPDSVNDYYGYNTTLTMLDDYIAEVKSEE